MSFIAENAGTIATALIVASVLFLILRKIIKDAKSGKGLCGCGGGCSCSCGSVEACDCQTTQSIVENIKGN